MSSFRATRMKEQIVKIPQNKIVITLGWPQATVAGAFKLDKNFAINQKCKKLNPGKMDAQLSDLLRCREPGQSSRNLRIADFEQRARPGRFQDDLVATPSHVSEPR